MTFLVLSYVYTYYCCFILSHNLLGSKNQWLRHLQQIKVHKVQVQVPTPIVNPISSPTHTQHHFKTKFQLHALQLMTIWLLIIMLLLVKVLEWSLKKILTLVVLRSPPSCKLGVKFLQYRDNFVMSFKIRVIHLGLISRNI